MAYKEFYFISDSEGNVTSYDVENITQNSNNIKVNFCGNYSDNAVVKLTILQANNVTLPTRIVPLTAEVYEIGEVEYRIYQYRMVQDDTKICPSATGTIKFTFTVEEDGEEILTTIPIGLTVVQSNTSAVTNTPADTIDSVVGQLNQDTADLADLQTQFAAFDTDISGKVDKTTTIAGINLTNNIAAQPLSDALEIDAKVQGAKDYSDGNLGLANNYTDNEVLGAKQEANNYTDEQLNNYVSQNDVGSPDGVCPLENSKIPSTYLPAYVDDVIEVATFSALPTGESGKLYITLDTNLTYRWSGTQYTEVSKSLALGETESTAYRGDRGKTAYDLSTAHETNKVDKVTTGSKKQVYGVNSSNEQVTYDIAAANGIASLDANAKVPLEQISVMPWTTGTVSSNAFTADCTANTNYILTNTQDVALTIANAYNGYYFEIEMHGGYALNLPANCKTDASFAYTTVLDNTQYYIYGFSFNGSVWKVMRNVYDE